MEVGRKASHLAQEKFQLLKSLNQRMPDGLMDKDECELKGTRIYGYVRKDIQKLKVPNWKSIVQDRRRWKEMVEKANTLHKELYSHNKKIITVY